MTDDNTDTTPTYADQWREAINETYTDREDLVSFLVTVDQGDLELDDDETVEHAVSRILSKAPDALRKGIPATFTGPELDLVRHLMPAHEVHQSGAIRWVRELYGYCDPAKMTVEGVVTSELKPEVDGEG